MTKPTKLVFERFDPIEVLESIDFEEALRTLASLEIRTFPIIDSKPISEILEKTDEHQ